MAVMLPMISTTAAQCRIAVVLAVAVAVWIGACAILGAALVAG